MLTYYVIGLGGGGQSPCPSMEAQAWCQGDKITFIAHFHARNTWATGNQRQARILPA